MCAYLLAFEAMVRIVESKSTCLQYVSMYTTTSQCFCSEMAELCGFFLNVPLYVASYTFRRYSKNNPHLFNWTYVIWFDKHQPHGDIFFINTWQCALHLRPEEISGVTDESIKVTQILPFFLYLQAFNTQHSTCDTKFMLSHKDGC